MKNILIVGAGAVGQVYGYQFANAGNKVSFLVKEKYQAELEKGLTLYNLRSDKHKRSPIHFNQFDILTSWDQATQQAETSAWDQVYLCISSTALLNFDFDGLNSALSPHTTIVLLQPGPQDYALTASKLNEGQIVQGMITLISYDAPLPKETVPKPGVAFWLPPLAATPFSGVPPRRKDIIDTFKKAQMSATAKANLRTMAPYPTAALMAFLSALEASEWNFRQLQSDKRMQQHMITAQKQAFLAISKESHSKIPFWNHLVHPWMINVALRIAPKAVPLDLETYFQVHFTKVKDQTKLFMRTYIETAESFGLAASDLIELNNLTN